MRESIVMDGSPCIVLATSGMMNGGPVMNYFQNWAHEPRNSLCFVGYQAEGTLGRRLQKGFSEVPMVINGQTEIVKSVARWQQSTDSVVTRQKATARIHENMSPRPKNVICHHGDYFKCNELGRTLREKFKVRTYAPQNLETIRLS